MGRRLVAFALAGALLSVASAQLRRYFFVNELLNWTQAQSYCRDTHTDLATIEDLVEARAVLTVLRNRRGKAWIGLHDDLESSWMWSLGDSSFYGEGETEFRDWSPRQPDNRGGQEYCVELTAEGSSGRWADTECSLQRSFVCYNGTINDTESFVGVDMGLTWTEAQTFCRENYVDLASIRNETENEIVANLIDGNSAWIGLHREKVWSDGSTSLFRQWAPEQPDSGGEQCVTVAAADAGQWSDDNCFSSFPFVCQETLPANAEGFTATGQNETSITLQWNRVSAGSFFDELDGQDENGGEDFIFPEARPQPDILGTTATVSPTTEGSRTTEQNPTITTLQPGRVNRRVTFILQFNGTETDISAPDGEGLETFTVPFLTPGTVYTFTLFYVIGDFRSTGISITAITAPSNADGFRTTEQNETSITLQWDQVNPRVSFILQFDDTEVEISAPDGERPVTHTVSALTAGTEYTFTLFSVFRGLRSSGVSVTTATAPSNADGFRTTEQNQTSITLQWDQVNPGLSFILQFDDTEVDISAPDGEGPVSHTVSSLTAGTEYTFTLFSVFGDLSSSGVSVTAATAPSNAGSFRKTDQSQTSITLQWDQVNPGVSFILQFDDTEVEISAPDGEGPVTHTVSSLTAGTEYTFTLFSVFGGLRSSGVSVTAATAPLNADGLRRTDQSQTSITLQWDQVNPGVSFILQFDDAEVDISAPDGEGPVTHTVSSLTAGTEYTFTLFSVFRGLRSSGVSVTAATAPSNPDGFRTTEQNQTSITLQWDQVNPRVSFILQFDDTEVDISAPDGEGPVSHTVSSLTAGTEYTFTLFSVFGDLSSSGVSVTAATAPLNADGLRRTDQSQTSITLQWDQVNPGVSFILQFDDTEVEISAPDGEGPVTHTVSSLTAGTEYTFTLFSVFGDLRSSGVSVTAATAPSNAGGFRTTDQSQTSITLQWDQVNPGVSFILQFDDTEVEISAPDGDGPVSHTVSSLTAGTEYTFTLFSVFGDLRSSGVSVTAATAPSNADGFRTTEQNQTSITLQWDQVNPRVSFILQFDDTEVEISAPDGEGPVTHTVSSLTTGTEYTFTLFSVFRGLRSSGVSVTATPDHVIGLNIRLRSIFLLQEADIGRLIEEFFRQNRLPLQSLRVQSSELETETEDFLSAF